MTQLPPREEMAFDVLIVGAGPAGLAAAIRLKQGAAEKGMDIAVALIEKASEVGGHILSGAVIDPIGIDRLLPDWRQDAEHPFKVPVREEHFFLFGPAGSWRLPNALLPRMMHNHGNFIVSLGDVCRYLGKKAEELGVEIYPGFAGSEILTDSEGRVIGVATGDMGRARDGSLKSNFTRGVALLAKYTLIAEGARGSLGTEVIARYSLNQGREPQKFGIGFKELWHIDEKRHRPGRIEHGFGWPLGRKAGGGSFLYHLDDRKVAIGLVVHLDYRNPYLSPFDEFQRFKTHPAIAGLLEGGARLAYGARAVSEGGWQSVPKLTFPGGALLGCAAGFVNLPRIKGSHNAMLSGIEAADAVIAALSEGRAHDELSSLEEKWRESALGRDLYPARNIKPLWSRLGLWGVPLGAIDLWLHQIFRTSFLGTLRHGKADHAALEPAARHKPISYPKPDGVLTFDRASSVYLANIHHDPDQPVHLRVHDAGLQHASEWTIFAGPSARYCPAGVYEWMSEEGGEARLVINAQNCVHCKTCDIKDPNQNITWVPPEGANGPYYQEM